MRYVSSRDKKAWLELASEEPSELHQSIRPKSETIFRALRPIGARYVAGTDSGGGYEFMVPGFALGGRIGWALVDEQAVAAL